jgi:hypothetical protein
MKSRPVQALGFNVAGWFEPSYLASGRASVAFHIIIAVDRASLLVPAIPAKNLPSGEIAKPRHANCRCKYSKQFAGHGIHNPHAAMEIAGKNKLIVFGKRDCSRGA